MVRVACWEILVAFLMHCAWYGLGDLCSSRKYASHVSNLRGNRLGGGAVTLRVCFLVGAAVSCVTVLNQLPCFRKNCLFFRCAEACIGMVLWFA
jgi:hypothetical protein